MDDLTLRFVYDNKDVYGHWDKDKKPGKEYEDVGLLKSRSDEGRHG